MSFPEIFLPEDISNETLQSLYDQSGMQTRIDSDGDLVVTRGVTCYAIPTRESERILLLTFVGTREGVQRDQKLEFTNRVNQQISTVRAYVDRKESVIFDYSIPVEGGVTPQAVVAVTKFFLIAAAHAIDQCDEADIVR